MPKFITGICILLLVAAVGMWVRSYRVYDQVIFVRRHPLLRTAVLWGLTSDAGRCRVGWQESEMPVSAGFAHGSGQVFVWTGDKTFMNRLGFGWGSGRNVLIQDQNISYQSLAFPYWAVVVAVASVPPARWMLVRRRRRKEAAGAKYVGTGRRWLDHPRVRAIVTPVTVLTFALLAGFCAVRSIIDLLMMFAGLITPNFLFLVLPCVMTVVAVHLWRLRRRLKRRNAGLCETCGYDVSASESGVCPECGTAIPIVSA